MDAVVTIQEYRHVLRARNYAKSTLRSYENGLRQFSAYLEREEITDLRQVTYETIRNYQQAVMAEPIAIESKALKIRPVKRLFEYLTETHKLLINPTDGIVETCRRNKKIGPVLTIEEVQRLLKMPNLSLKTGIRDRAVMGLLYSSGIRANELINLEIYHVDLQERVVYIRKGKGKRQRVVPLGKNAAFYIGEYLKKIRPHYAKKTPKERRLFLNVHGLPLTAESMRLFIARYGRAAGIKTSVSPHTLRRSCATHLMQQGVDIRYVQKLLGHKRLSSTQGYTKVRPVEVKKTHNATHPGRKKCR